MYKTQFPFLDFHEITFRGLNGHGQVSDSDCEPNKDSQLKVALKICVLTSIQSIQYKSWLVNLVQVRLLH